MNSYDIEEFCCEFGLAQHAIEAMFDMEEMADCEMNVAILCQEDLAQKLLKIFSTIAVNDFEFDFGYLEFDSYDYEDEYAVILSSDGFVSVDKARYDDGEYKLFEEDYVLVSDECSPKLFIKQVKAENNMTAFSLKNDCE